MEKVPLTPQGFERLNAELKHLKVEERPAIIRAIAEAREHGDLSENAEYHAARERQSFVEGRILELEDKISRAEVIDTAKFVGSKTVKFGAFVTVIMDDSEQETTYQLIGADETDIERNMISITSPLGKALIGKAQGDYVEVNTPSGAKGYEIMQIRFE
jgi:transcription elongation factor GreA